MLALLAALLLGGCRDETPATPAETVATPEAVSGESAPAGGGAAAVPDEARLPIVLGDFFAGAIALQVGDPDTARAKLEAAVDAAPAEPAAWANLAIARLRGNAPDQEAAEAAMAEARRLAPRDDGVAVVDAAVLARLGRMDEARDALRRAVSVAPDNLRARFALFEALDAAGEDEAAGEALAELRARAPENLAAAVAALRRAAVADDAQGIAAMLAVIDARSMAVPEDAREQLAVVREALEGGAVSSASGAAVGLANLLLGSEVYRADQAVLATDFENVAEPLMTPLTLPVPAPAAAPADTTLGWSPAVTMDFDGVPPAEGAHPLRLVAVAREEGREILPFVLRADGPRDAIAIDVDNDGRLERVEAGDAGVRVVAAAEPDASGAESEPSVVPVTGDAMRRVWAVDLDLEGDLDLVLAPAGEGEAVTLRNDGDGGWTPFASRPLGSLSAPRDLVWFDEDGDGDGDLASIDAAGRLRRFANERAGVYREHDALAAADGAANDGGEDAAPSLDARWLALAVADVGLSGRLSLLALRADGAVFAFDAGDEPRELVRWQGEPPSVEGAPLAALHWADLDNNGAGDLVVGWGGASQVWLAGEDAALAPLRVPFDGRVDDVADVDGDGRLDLLGVARDAAENGVPGEPVSLAESLLVLRNQGGERDYGWQVLRFAAQTTGDDRNNLFGLGGEVALRSGLLLQARAVERPWLHFGLGEAAADVLRVRWPNGAIQGEFDLERDARVAVEQRLVGSCPWLFAWDGEAMGFVTDILWRSPLGLRINAQTTAGVLMTRDRVKVAGEQLVPRDGAYDLRVTAELWETHFFDHVGLTVVDHPEGVEVWIDERFKVPPQSLEVHATGPLRPLVAATGASGADVRALLAERDGRYVDDFALGQYQGVAGDHALELLLDDAPSTATAGEVLVTQGWIYPTDSSINVALSQGEHVPPVPLSIEVPDVSAEGGWRVAREGLGFPAGKRKTMLLDLDGLWPEGAERRLRLRTTLEIYWDRIAVAERRPEAEIRVTELRPDVADLRGRGFSATSHWPVRRLDAAGSRRAPEIPVYENLATRQPMWLDLAGRYTRFGDVGELLEQIDDRYVILNAGDEMAFRFPALADPEPGWARDFVFESDGWVKDGNFNTAYSATVHPLPAHDRPEYADQVVRGPVGELAEDPVFQAHAADWALYHTREVRPVHFAEVMRPVLPGAGDEAAQQD